MSYSIMANSSSGSDMSGGGSSEGTSIPMAFKEQTFDGCEGVHTSELEKRIEEEKKKKRSCWEKDVQNMRDEFLSLYASDKKWGSDEMLSDPMVSTRKGSTDVLDIHYMKTVFPDYPAARRRFKLRFNCAGFLQKTIKVNTDGERIIVTGSKLEKDNMGLPVEREYIRKIEKPKRVDSNKLKSILTSDGILIVQAAVQAPSPLKNQSKSLSGSKNSVNSQSSVHDEDPPSPCRDQKLLEPVLVQHENGVKYIRLVAEIGTYFNVTDIHILILKNSFLQIKAKHEERTAERLFKYKFSRTFELPDKIDSFATRGGVTEEGRIVIGCGVKGHFGGMTVEQVAEWIIQEIGIDKRPKYRPCNVLDLSVFPPTHVMSYFMMPKLMK